MRSTITRATLLASVGLAASMPAISAGQVQVPGGTEQGPARPPDTGVLAGTVEVRPEIRAITVTPNSIALSDCDGESTVLELPSGTCSSGSQPITVTNVGTAGNVFVSASSLRGQDSTWHLCGGVDGGCHGASPSQPGRDEAGLTLSGDGTFYRLASVFRMDPHFGLSEPNAARGESHAYGLSLKAPASSASTSTTRAFTVTWSVRPAPPI